MPTSKLLDMIEQALAQRLVGQRTGGGAMFSAHDRSGSSPEWRR